MLATCGGLLLLAACVAQIINLLRKKEDPDSFSHYLVLGGAVLLLAHLGVRSLRIHFVAVTNTFESLLFFAAFIGIVVFLYRLLAKKKALPLVMFGATVIAVILLALASSPLASREIEPPIPALQSGWLVLHVTMAFIGEAFFTLGFIVAILYLVTQKEQKRKELDRLMYRSIAIGYPIFTAGALIFGAIWAEVSWGHYWSWDPKEIWALITWLVYTLYLHLRFLPRMRGRFSAWLSIIGFIFTLFTFFGVNYLLTSLHSY